MNTDINLDEKVSMQSIVDALSKKGVTVSDIAKIIPGLSEASLRDALKAAEYEYDRSLKMWYFVGEGEKPSEQSIFDFVEKPKKRTAQINLNNPARISNDEQLTQEEIRMLRKMLNEWTETGLTEQEDSVHNKIKNMEINDLIRSRIMLSQRLKQRLETFCDREKFYKYDVLNLALEEFFEKYDSYNSPQ
ncbi:hypothetical protein ACR6EC_22325 [Bacillus subtilis]|uniref:hypothetical protein n=1 Tax=Bacillus subtilis group TaxID=653685 RepID=UPI001B987478|nr:hypothetical protein [Bacillus subtilis]MEC2400507.1 hypothetical protein [Bacillus subtilis]MED4660867.1 hypothetical protein [Bacillus subtilis]MED4667709.1 hypothetical protein [Bacillus subtilis]WEZ26737.1 hypothetical protein P5635_00070 [Bacillus subtilis]CAF1785261.1 hypothetical protein NRS6107_04086 [Bacillus subtilis]